MRLPTAIFRLGAIFARGLCITTGIRWAEFSISNLRVALSYHLAQFKKLPRCERSAPPFCPHCVCGELGTREHYKYAGKQVLKNISAPRQFGFAREITASRKTCPPHVACREACLPQTES
jgi:hypothetical protein